MKNVSDKCSKCNVTSDTFQDQWIGCTLCPTAWICFKCAFESLPCVKNLTKGNFEECAQNFYNDIQNKQKKKCLFWHYFCDECSAKLPSLNATVPLQVNNQLKKLNDSISELTQKLAALTNTSKPLLNCELHNDGQCETNNVGQCETNQLNDVHCLDVIPTENSKVNPSVKHTLLLKPNDASTDHYTESSWATVTKKNLPHLLHDIPVTKSALTKQGKGYLLFPDQKSRDNAKDSLKNVFHIECETKVSTLLFPKITINGIDRHIYKPNNKNDLKDAILQKNESIRELVQNQDKKFVNCVY